MYNYAQLCTSLIADCRPLHIIHYSLFFILYSLRGRSKERPRFWLVYGCVWFIYPFA